MQLLQNSEKIAKEIQERSLMSPLIKGLLFLEILMIICIYLSILYIQIKRGSVEVSEKENKYNIEIAKSDKKASTAVNSFKIRKSGNSSIVTVPNAVKETLRITDGDEVQYVTIKDEKDESKVVMKKMTNEKNEQNDIDEEVKDLLVQT